jgi:hypothetical protein
MNNGGVQVIDGPAIEEYRTQSSLNVPFFDAHLFDKHFLKGTACFDPDKKTLLQDLRELFKGLLRDDEGDGCCRDQWRYQLNTVSSSSSVTWNFTL